MLAINRQLKLVLDHFGAGLVDFPPILLEDQLFEFAPLYVLDGLDEQLLSGALLLLC